MNIKKTFNKFLTFARTPMQRIGLVFLFLAFIVQLATIIHWNTTEKLFIYVSNHHGIIDYVAQPKSVVDGLEWKSDLRGWQLVDLDCQRAASTHSLDSFFTKEECVRKRISHKYGRWTRWNFTFDDYFDEFFRRRGEYKWLTIPLSVFYMLGAVFYIGLADRVIRWIKSGQ